MSEKELTDFENLNLVSNTPFFAELDKLESCLQQLGRRPLKLIADERWTRPGIKEIAWEQPEWDFSADNELIIKPLLLNPADGFQFSIATEASKQDWHYHQFTFEIYVSNDLIELEYRSPTAGNTPLPVRVLKGVLMVPPGLVHKVHLSGSTFVFQVSLTGKPIHHDKITV